MSLAPVKRCSTFDATQANVQRAPSLFNEFSKRLAKCATLEKLLNTTKERFQHKQHHLLIKNDDVYLENVEVHENELKWILKRVPRIMQLHALSSQSSQGKFM